VWVCRACGGPKASGLWRALAPRPHTTLGSQAGCSRHACCNTAAAPSCTVRCSVEDATPPPHARRLTQTLLPCLLPCAASVALWLRCCGGPVVPVTAMKTSELDCCGQQLQDIARLTYIGTQCLPGSSTWPTVCWDTVSVPCLSTPLTTVPCPLAGPQWPATSLDVSAVYVWLSSPKEHW
jgi:hypothetical protein